MVAALPLSSPSLRLTSPALPNPLLLAGFLITKLGVGVLAAQVWGLGRAGQAGGHMSACSETSHPKGSKAGLGYSPQLP